MRISPLSKPLPRVFSIWFSFEDDEDDKPVVFLFDFFDEENDRPSASAGFTEM